MQPYVFAFADNGNITAKTDAGGKYIYHPTKINAVQYIKDYTSAIPPLQQDIIYTPFLRPLKITEGVNELEYTYASDYERRKGVLRKSGAIENTRLYLGDYEINTDKNGVKTTIHYLSGGEAIVVKRDNAAFEYYFPYTDHLGSIVAVTSTVGTVVAEQNFDAWGRKRNPTNWSYDNVPSVPTWLYRGYTGHEHLSEFNLINMNARLYDPVLGRMLSPDNFLGSGTQGFNRYSYANNNPLKYTDPSGNFAWLVGAAVGAAIDLGFQLVANKGDLSSVNWGSVLVSAASGAVGGGIGNLVGKAGWVTKLVGKIAKTPIWQAVARGAISGSIGGAAGSATGGFLNGQRGWNLAGTTLFGFVSGGVIGGVVGGIQAKIGLNRAAKAAKLNEDNKIATLKERLEGQLSTQEQHLVQGGGRPRTNFMSEEAAGKDGLIGFDDLTGEFPNHAATPKRIAQFSSKSIDEAVDYVFRDANKVSHLFASKHNFGTIVERLGGEENAFKAILNRAAESGTLPAAGVFKDIPVNYFGETIFLRGNVVNGVPKIGTMFIR